MGTHGHPTMHKWAPQPIHSYMQPRAPNGIILEEEWKEVSTPPIQVSWLCSKALPAACGRPPKKKKCLNFLLCRTFATAKSAAEGKIQIFFLSGGLFSRKGTFARMSSRPRASSKLERASGPPKAFKLVGLIKIGGESHHLGLP